MAQSDWQTEEFERHRRHLQSVAYRMLGSASEAEDAVQEAWVRLSRAGDAEVDNLRGWLTTVVARVCLDVLRSRRSRREDYVGSWLPEPIVSLDLESDPAAEALLADSVGIAMLVVLETLAPAERLAFVLHDMFGVPFEEIAPIVGRTPAAARQLASRARRRVQGKPQIDDPDLDRQRRVVDVFLAAARNGDFEGLLAVLDPDVVARADEAAARLGSRAEIRGAPAVADFFKGRAQSARPALVDGALGVAVVFGGQLRVVLRLAFAGDRISGVEAIADAKHIASMDTEMLEP